MDFVEASFGEENSNLIDYSFFFLFIIDTIFSFFFLSYQILHLAFFISPLFSQILISLSNIHPCFTILSVPQLTLIYIR